MKCKLSGLECNYDKFGYCKLYNKQLKDVSKTEINNCLANDVCGLRKRELVEATYEPEIVQDELPKELQDELTVMKNGTVINSDVFAKALKKWGSAFEIDMCIEEMSELTQALCKLKRGKSHNVEEEIADVMIMLEQIKLLFDVKQIDKWLSFKIQKLEIMLEESEKCQKDTE